MGRNNETICNPIIAAPTTERFMASGKVDSLKYFATDTGTLVQSLGASGGVDVIIPEDGLYFVRVLNYDTSTYMAAGIRMGGSQFDFITNNYSPGGTYVYLTSGLVPLKKGTKIWVESHSQRGGGLYKV